MKRLIMVFACLAVLMNLNCGPAREIVKLDLTSFNENPEAYAGKRVIITTDIASLLNNPTPYYHKDIEISGFINKTLFGLDWGFYLEDETGLSIKCYERNYRHYPWRRADMAVKRARRNKENITIVGVFGKLHDIELDWIEVGGETIDTDYKPYSPAYPR
jgi:hypothetical protein